MQHCYTSTDSYAQRTHQTGNATLQQLIALSSMMSEFIYLAAAAGYFSVWLYMQMTMTTGMGTTTTTTTAGVTMVMSTATTTTLVELQLLQQLPLVRRIMKIKRLLLHTFGDHTLGSPFRELQC